MQTTALASGARRCKAGRFLSGDRLPQLAARAHLGLRRRAARLPGDARRAVRRRRPAAALAARRPTSTSSSALEVGRGRELPGGDDRQPQRRRHGRALRAHRRRHRRRATAGAPACRCCRRRPRAVAGREARRRRRPLDQSFSGSTRVVASPTASRSGRRTATRRARNFKLQGEYLQAGASGDLVARRRRATASRCTQRAVGLVRAGRLPVHADAGASACATTASTPGTPDYRRQRGVAFALTELPPDARTR